MQSSRVKKESAVNWCLSRSRAEGTCTRRGNDDLDYTNLGKRAWGFPRRSSFSGLSSGVWKTAFLSTKQQTIGA